MSKALVIIGGSLVKNSDGTWRTTTFSEGDEFGALGDQLRVRAGSMLWSDNPDSKVIVLGGKGQLAKFEDAPTISETIKHELEGMGVPSEHIVTETESGTTYQQLESAKQILRDHGITEAVLITNAYHIPRVQAILDTNNEWRDIMSDMNVRVMSAEDVIIEHEPEAKEDIDQAYQSEVMKERIALEEQGVRQIREGTYKFR